MKISHVCTYVLMLWEKWGGWRRLQRCVFMVCCVQGTGAGNNLLFKNCLAILLRKIEVD